MVTTTSEHRPGLAAILFAGVLLASAGCSSPSDGSGQAKAPATDPVATEAPADTSAASTGTGTQLSKIDPCDLVTRDEVTAALGAPIIEPANTGTSDAIISCVFQAPSNSSAITLVVERPAEGAETLMGHSRIPGARSVVVVLGDDAFATSTSVKAPGLTLRGDVVWVRKGDLVLSVNQDLPHGGGVKTRDPSAYDASLAKLAGQALARLPR